MYLRNAAGQRLVPGLDIYCSEHRLVGQIMGTQLLMKRCLVQLRNGTLIFVNAADVVIASWGQIGSAAHSATFDVRAEAATKHIAPQFAA